MRGYTLIIVNVKIVNLDEELNTYKIVNAKCNHTYKINSLVNIVNVNEGIHTYKFTNSVSSTSSKPQRLHEDYFNFKTSFFIPLGIFYEQVHRNSNCGIGRLHNNSEAGLVGYVCFDWARCP